MIRQANKNNLRKSRHVRIRKKVFGTASKPRLSVFRSLNHIYVQAIDDTCGHTIVAASSKEKDFPKSKEITGGNITGAKKVGELLGKRLQEKKITTLVFDRSGYLYHGRIAALADGARSTGLVF